MSISSIDVNQFRNIYKANLRFSKQVNYIIGPNGSGKSSLIEALYYCCMGRSFRTQHISSIVQRDQDSFLLFASLLDFFGEEKKVGISKTLKGETSIKVDGMVAQSVSQLANIQPAILVSPESIELVSGSPSVRRKYLDWGLFHVEQSFLKIWQQFQSALKQRNALLKSNTNDSRELNIWTSEFVEQSLKINGYREKYCDSISGIINAVCKSVLPQFDFSFKYYTGWEKGKDLLEKLEQITDYNLKLGHTTIGPHKAEFTITVGGKLASHVLSRGQMKLLVFALYVAQAQLLYKQSSKRCVILIDDISSELDNDNQQLLLKKLLDCEHQLFITSTEKPNGLNEITDKLVNSQTKMFHVEHGEILTVQ